MSIEKHCEVIYYVNICKSCGIEFHVAKNSTTEVCYKCQTEEAVLRAKEKLTFLIGAKITNIVPEETGHLTDYNSIESIEVETTDGKRVLFRLGDYYDDCSIEWDEQK